MIEIVWCAFKTHTNSTEKKPNFFSSNLSSELEPIEIHQHQRKMKKSKQNTTKDSEAEETAMNEDNLPKIVIKPDMESAKKVSKMIARLEKIERQLNEGKKSLKDKRK